MARAGSCAWRQASLSSDGPAIADGLRVALESRYWLWPTIR